MYSSLEIDSGNSEKLEQIINLSLESGEKVEYNISSKDNKLNISIDANGIGVLRGCTDTAFRLTTLANKLYLR